MPAQSARRRRHWLLGSAAALLIALALVLGSAALIVPGPVARLPDGSSLRLSAVVSESSGSPDLICTGSLLQRRLYAIVIRVPPVAETLSTWFSDVRTLLPGCWMGKGLLLLTEWQAPPAQSAAASRPAPAWAAGIPMTSPKGRVVGVLVNARGHGSLVENCGGCYPDSEDPLAVWVVYNLPRRDARLTFRLFQLEPGRAPVELATYPIANPMARVGPVWPGAPLPALRRLENTVVSLDGFHLPGHHFSPASLPSTTMPVPITLSLRFSTNRTARNPWLPLDATMQDACGNRWFLRPLKTLVLADGRVRHQLDLGELAWLPAEETYRVRLEFTRALAVPPSPPDDHILAHLDRPRFKRVYVAAVPGFGSDGTWQESCEAYFREPGRLGLLVTPVGSGDTARQDGPVPRWAHWRLKVYTRDTSFVGVPLRVHDRNRRRVRVRLLRGGLTRSLRSLEYDLADYQPPLTVKIGLYRRRYAEWQVVPGGVR